MPAPAQELPEEKIEDENADPEDDVEEDEAVPDMPAYTPDEQTLKDLKFAHDNSGHPTNADFARMLRLGNAKPEVVKWVRKNFHCPDCAANKRPYARRLAAVPKTYQFNHVVGVLSLIHI